MKKISIVILTTLLAFIVLPVRAEDNSTRENLEVTRGPVEARATQIQERKTTIQANTMDRLKQKANNEIDRRLASLSKLIEKINAAKRLSIDQKTTMASQIQEEMTSLNTLKTKIAADTDIATLRTDVQSIVKSYRVYLLYIPKMTIIANADKILALIEGEMATLTTKLNMRIEEMSKNGIDVTTLTGLMAQRSAKITEATTQATGAISKVVGLTPDGWPGNKTDLQSARDMLQVARKDLNDAQKLANQVRGQFKAVKPTGTSKPTATPTP